MAFVRETTIYGKSVARRFPTYHWVINHFIMSCDLLKIKLKVMWLSYKNLLSNLAQKLKHHFFFKPSQFIETFFDFLN